MAFKIFRVPDFSLAVQKKFSRASANISIFPFTDFSIADFIKKTISGMFLKIPKSEQDGNLFL
jgi:hypothetical protein